MTTAPADDLLLTNRVAASGIITLNLEELLPPGSHAELDLQPALFMGLILKEKDFREWVAAHPWDQYQGRHVAVHCSADAVIPAWAYMLAASHLQPYAASVHLCPPAQLAQLLYTAALATHHWPQYQGQRVILKGCGGVPPEAYLLATSYLRPYVKTLMYGEPCSTVPVYKQKAAPAPAG